MKKFIFVLILCLSQVINISAQVVSSGKVPVFINNKTKPEVKQNKLPVSEPINNIVQSAARLELPIGGGKYYALIIGINNYSDPLINQLDYSVRDAEMFYNTLTTRYTFEAGNVKLLRNATYEDIVNALDYFAKAVQPVDNFLIFYAGHGYWNATSEIGFWLPNDAQKNSTRNWFRNSVLRDYLREINSKHTLLITDACFGGSIFKTRSAFMDATIAINKLYELPSRKAMTSGTLTVVPDQSAFLKYLVDRLQNNFEKYLSSEQLFSNFRMAVINNSNVLPQFGVIQDVGDEGGDFIFILKK
jgi:Caspase domain